MVDEAHTLGASDALLAYGLKEANARLIGSLVGAGLGAAAAPDGEGMQGALLGGLGGYTAGAGVSRAYQGAKGLALQGFEAIAPKMDPRVLLGSPVLQGAAPQVRQSAGKTMKKVADMGIGVGLPGTPIGLNFGTKQERLPGMNKWVDRDIIERAYEALDAGLDPQAIMERESERGNLKHPAIGGGMAAALAHFNLPKASPSSTLVAGAGGAALGALYNRFTAKNRASDAAEALKGIARERGPIRGQDRMTASENTPMIVARSGQ
jgi:hypothetical protein